VVVFPWKKNIVIFNIMHTVRFWYNLYQLLSWPKEFRIYVGFCFDFSLFRAYRINNIPTFRCFVVISIQDEKSNMSAYGFHIEHYKLC
jgi:hypothetical protein